MNFWWEVQGFAKEATLCKGFSAKIFAKRHQGCSGKGKKKGASSGPVPGSSGCHPPRPCSVCLLLLVPSQSPPAAAAGSMANYYSRFPGGPSSFSSSFSRGGSSPSPSAPVEYVPVGLPPRSLLDQLLGGMQAHLEEMERMRLALTQAFPGLAGGGSHPKAAAGPFLLLQEPREGKEQGYRFALDVAGFQPEEMAVKVDGRKLMVSAKHDKRSESADGCLSHEYREVRKELLLPDDANLQALTCTFSPDEGRLRLEAPRMALPPTEEKAIPITICKGPDTGTPAAPVKEPLPSASPEKGAASK